MRRLWAGTPKKLRRGIAVASLALLAALASTAVYAAATKTFRLSATPTSQTINKGQAASYTVTVNRRNGFSDPVTLSTSKLPPGATASWKLANGTVSNVVPKNVSSATLTVQTSTSTPAGNYTPKITGAGGGVTSSITIGLSVLGTAQQNFTVEVSPSSRTVLQGDTSDDYTVTINRSGGFDGPVSLAVSGLPSGAGASWDPSPPTVPGSSSNATLRVDTQSTTPKGSYPLTITGTGTISHSSVTRSTAATLVVQETVPMTVSGGPSGQLRPGAKQPLDLTLTNPYSFTLKVTSLNATLREATSKAGCSGSDNFQVTQLDSGAYPLTLPPGSRKLSELGVSGGLLPQVEMRDLATNQDACKGATLNFDYTGGGTK